MSATAAKAAANAATKLASTVSTATAASSTKMTAAAKRGRRNLYELVTVLPQYGAGTRVTRSIWNGFESYYTLTQVKPTKDLSHGAAWGVKTWRGQTDATPTRVPGGLKKEWKFFSAPPSTAELKRAPAKAATAAAEGSATTSA